MNKKIIYQLKEFGLSIDKLPVRFASSAGPRIFVNSLPKSGTNLITRTLSQFPYIYRPLCRTLSEPKLSVDRIITRLENIKTNQFLIGHLWYDDKYQDAMQKRSVKQIVVIRDLRDVLISKLFYILNNDRDHILHSKLNTIQSISKQLEMLLIGCKLPNEDIRDDLTGLVYEWSKFKKWINQKSVIIVKFEDLIGESGGGSKDNQVRVVKTISQFLDIEMSNKHIDEVCRKIFYSKSKTFRSGKIGGWKECFDNDLEGKFKYYLGDELINLGYETDMEW